MCISLFWIKNSFFCLFYGLLLLFLSFWESWTYIQILKPVSDCFIIFLWHEFFQLLHLLLDFQGILFNVCWKYFMSNFKMNQNCLSPLNQSCFSSCQGWYSASSTQIPVVYGWVSVLISWYSNILNIIPAYNFNQPILAHLGFCKERRVSAWA